MKKTYKEFSAELDETLGFAARKAVGRRMKMMARKGTVKMKKKLNMMRALPIAKARNRAMKWVRNWVKQRLIGKSKNLADISMGQKIAIDKKVDQKVKMMGSKVKAMVKKQTKLQIKKHKERKKQMMDARKGA